MKTRSAWLGEQLVKDKPLSFRPLVPLTKLKKQSKQIVIGSVLLLNRPSGFWPQSGSMPKVACCHAWLYWIPDTTHGAN